MTAFLAQYQSPEPLVYDFVADFAGDFEAWNAELQTLEGINRDVVLNIPSGTYLPPAYAFPGNGNLGNTWNANTNIGRNHTVHILGQPDRSAIIDFSVNGGTNRNIDASYAIGNTALPYPRIATAPAGQKFIQLLTLSDYTEFTVDDFICVCGVDMQLFGYPPNQHFQEFRRVTEIDSSTGILTLDRPLLYTYKSTWPNYGGTFPDSMGAATAVPAPHSWGSNWILEGLTVKQNQQNTSPARSTIYRNCLFTGQEGPLPTMCESFVYDNCTFASGTGGIETDKFIGKMEWINSDMTGVVSGIQVQSSSHHRLNVLGCDLIQNIGAGRNLTIKDSVISGAVNLEVTAAGCNESATLIDSVLQNGIYDNGFQQSVPLTNDCLGFAAGAFSWADANLFPDNPPRTIVEGGVYILSAGSNLCGPVFRIIDITQSGGNTYYHTDIVGTPPQIAIATGILQYPGYDLTISGCTPLNVSAATDTTHAQPIGYLQTAGAAGRPLYTYYESGPLDTIHIFVSVNGENTVALPLGGAPMLIGNFVSLEVNVTKAYTGGYAGLRLKPWAGGGINMYTDATFASTAFYQPLIDPHVVGTRLIVPGTTTGTAGADSGLDLTADPHWVAGNSVVWADTDGGSPWLESSAVWPEFTVKMITDLDYE